jgi:flagellar hook protein FlgE
MFTSILNAFSGMLGFSKGLDVISNNLANLNTPGFKESELQFRDLFYRVGLEQSSGQSDQVGQGVSTGSSRTIFNQGNLQNTGNSLDVAINGNGFFVLRKDGQTFYTRTGQFQFNTDGVLIEQTSQAHVAGSIDGKLVDISLTGLRVNPAKPTTEVKFSGNLSVDANDPNANPPQQALELTTKVIDGAGTSRDLTIKFTNNKSVTARSWLIEVRDATGTVATGEIRYQGSGAPEVGFNALVFSYAPANTPATTIRLNFGDPGSTAGSTGLSGGTTSTLKVDTQNGIAPGSLVDASFDEEGKLTLKYSNGQTTTGDQLALASFENPQDLTLKGDNLYTAKDGQAKLVATASEKGLGKIAAKQIELSNVQLTEQFTNIVVIQRGFQASSQVISVTNEMMQQLLDLRARR